MEPGRPVALLSYYHTLDSPVFCCPRKGVVWLLVAVVAELTPMVSRFTGSSCVSSPLFITIARIGLHSFEP